MGLSRDSERKPVISYLRKQRVQVDCCKCELKCCYVSDSTWTRVHSWYLYIPQTNRHTPQYAYTPRTMPTTRHSPVQANPSVLVCTPRITTKARSTDDRPQKPPDVSPSVIDRPRELATQRLREREREVACGTSLSNVRLRAEISCPVHIATKVTTALLVSSRYCGKKEST